MELDTLDRTAAEAFPGSLVRKDLAHKFKGQYPVPTYVGEFLLGRYCATIDPDEIAEGLRIVERQLKERAVRAGEHELFKSRARELGSVKLIDLITARLDAETDSYMVTLPSLQLKDVRIADALVREHERMLTGGFYAEIELEYHPAMANESGGRPFSVASLRPIQISQPGVLDLVARGRSRLTTEQWRDLLLRSVGFEPARFDRRAQDLLLLRMVPFVERNYNMVELGPRGTGKSHLFQQVSPYAHLVSGGKATVARMFVNMTTGQRGLVAQYDVVCFDEVGGVDFDQKDGVNILKGYMESGEFSRGKESIRATGGIVMLGNFDVDVAQQLRVGHLFTPFPKEMRDDTAFMDRVHAYVPGWDLPKLDPKHFTSHFGLVTDLIAEAWSKLREEPRLPAIHGRVTFGEALSGRDIWAVNRTVSGLLKLLYPDASAAIPDEDLEWAVRLAMEVRLRVKEQQKRIGREEFGKTDFSYVLSGAGAERLVTTPEQRLHVAEEDTEHGPPVVTRRGQAPPRPSRGLGDDGELTPEDMRTLIDQGEKPTVEFKSSLRWSPKGPHEAPSIQKAVTKTIAAFLNGRGGTLLIGVSDGRRIVGIENDMGVLSDIGQGGHDGFLQALGNIINQHLGAGVTPLIRTQIVPLDGRQLCIVRVRPSDEPIYLHAGRDQDEFYVRVETTTRGLTLPEATRYIRSRWG